MRKNYIYAITLVFMLLLLWAGYYLYLEYTPVVYQNGILI